MFLKYILTTERHFMVIPVLVNMADERLLPSAPPRLVHVSKLETLELTFLESLRKEAP